MLSLQRKVTSLWVLMVYVVNFTRAMWGTMGDYFCYIVHDVFSSSFLSRFINKGTIKLIPKNFRRNTISRSHPITLLGVSYNFFPKTLAVRVHAITNEIV